MVDGSNNCLTSCPSTAPFWQFSYVNVYIPTVTIGTNQVPQAISHRFICVAECASLAVGADMVCYPNKVANAPLWKPIVNHQTQLYKFSATNLFMASQTVPTSNFLSACPFGSVLLSYIAITANTL